MKGRQGISIVIPVYRSEQTLPILMERLERVVNRLDEVYEVVFVCDGSPDKSWDVICQLQEKFPFVRGILLMRNYGQHNALLAGIRSTVGRIIVTLDDDLQNPPEEIPQLLEALKRGFDVVYGAREKEQNGIVRNLSSRLVKQLTRVFLQIPTATSITSFRAFRAHLVDAFDFQQGSCVFVDALLCWGTHKIGSVPVSHIKRQQGRSNYSIPGLVSHAVNLVTSFSTVPLRLSSLLGFVTTSVGVVFFIIVIVAFFWNGRQVPGFTFLAAALTLFAGVQLFVLGIVGEYLARIHTKLMGAPAYLIKESI